MTGSNKIAPGTEVRVSSTLTGSRTLWFEHVSRNRNPALRLFCFPYAGGSVDMFRSWQRHFPPEIALCLVHLPGHGRRFGEQPFTNLGGLVNAVAGQIGAELQQPFAFYGHSMGAMISFELAHEVCQRYGVAPVSLFLSGRRAPDIVTTEPPTYNLPHEDLIAKLKRLNGTPNEILENPDLLELFLPVLRADLEAVDTYQYRREGPLSCPITVYGGWQDADIPIESLNAWGKQTSKAFQVRMFAGDHFFISNPAVGFPQVLQQDVSIAIQKP